MSSPVESRAEYTVLARRFRPQSFAEVVGQEHVGQALRNAIEGGRVAHAYLFTGARGVGKTSMARILAKSLNCPNAVGPDACNECEICQGIATGSDVDVLEIDGASNRGIDDIRSLRQNVNVRSMRSRHKIYIIDEVHMLTKDAFNALLKTLEEPPANVKFIFCTTEPNKLPDTILSRCQRFDFGTIETSEIMTRLTQIAAAEGKKVDQAAVALVARRAGGSMRDSQSLFDQLLAYGGEEITAADVHRLLGTAPDERLIEIMDAVIGRRRSEILSLFHAALAGGVQLGELTDQLLSYTRDLMIFAAGAEGVPLLSVSEENAALLKEQADRWGLQTIVAALQILADAKGRMQRVSFGRAIAELALIRLSLLEDLQSLEQLLQDVRSGTVSTPAPGAKPLTARPSPRLLQAPVKPAGRTETAPGLASERPAPAKLIGGNGESVPPPEDAARNKPSDAPPASPQMELTAGQELEFWAQVLAKIPDMLKDHARRAGGVAILGPNHLAVSFPKRYDIARQYCERPDNLDRLQKLAAEVAGRPIRLSFQLMAGEAIDKSEPVAPRRTETPRRGEQIKDSLVQKALLEFGGAVMKAEKIADAGPAGS